MKMKLIPHTILPGLAALGMGLACAQAANTDIIAEIGAQPINAGDLAPYFENFTTGQRDALKQNPAALNQTVRLLLLQQVPSRKPKHRLGQESRSRRGTRPPAPARHCRKLPAHRRKSTG